MEEYRIDGPYHYDGKSNYCIEKKRKNGKWIFLFGGLTYSQASEYVKNPETIKTKVKLIKIQFFIVLIVLLFSLLCFLIY